MMMGLRIKELRMEREWSQAHLADLAGVSRSQLSEIENERKPANTLRLNAISSALGVSVDELFSEEAAASYRNEIIALMRDMHPDDREAVIRHAKALSKRK